jgi:hypothetical protein
VYSDNTAWDGACANTGSPGRAAFASYSASISHAINLNDTTAITHPITVNTGGVLTVSAAGVAVGMDLNNFDAIQVLGSGQLLDKGTLYLRGDLNQGGSGGTGTVEIGDATNGGGNLTFDPNTGNTHKWYAHGNTATIKFTGIASNRAVITTSTRGGGNGYFDLYNYALTQYHTWQYFDMINIGSTSQTAIDDRTHNYGTQIVQNAKFTNVGPMKISLYSPTNETWDTVSFISPAVNSSLNILNLGCSQTGGTRVNQNWTIYDGKGGQIFFDVQGATLSNFVGHNTLIDQQNSARTGITFDKYFMINDGTALGSGSQILIATGASTVAQNGILYTHVANPHPIAGMIHTTKSLFSADGYFSGDDGDYYNSSTNGLYDYNLFIEYAGALHIGTNATNRQILNNTFAGPYSHISIAEDNPTAAGALGPVKNNIFYNSTQINQLGYFQSQTGATIDYNAGWKNDFGISPANKPYTAGPLAGIVSYFGASTYNPWFSDGRAIGADGAGLHDIYADPKFRNPNWTVRGYFGAATVLDVAKEAVKLNGFDYQGNTAAQTAFTPANVLAAGRSAFTPTNMALKTAGEGGTYIGAVPPVGGNTLWW